MKILAIADRPPKKAISEIVLEEKIDLIITLGDLEYTEIAELEYIKDIPKIGVYGNHSTPGYMELLGITNLHLATTEINRVTFGGFEGSHKYKKDEFAKMYTQDEALGLMSEFPYVDVFIAHSPPAGINDEDDPAHQGLLALRQYLDRNKPRYFLHGHTYPTQANIVTEYNGTQIIYVTADQVMTLI
ncbi:metallophosphoesterase [Patescibacteria group bacterium]|nr:metallophosphoesterase [Patescibacteria group bacterium]